MMTAIVTYEHGVNADIDRRVRRMAGFQQGRECGSGQMIVAPWRRDLEFDFPNEWSKQRFVDGIPAVAHDYPKQNVRILG